MFGKALCSINQRTRFSGFISSDLLSLVPRHLVYAPPHSGLRPSPLKPQELTVSLPSWKTQLTASLSSSFADCVAKRRFLFTCYGLQELTASLLTSHTQLTASLSGFPADCVAGSSNSWERYGVSKLYCDYSSIWHVVWPRLYSLPWDQFLKTTSFLSNTLCAYFISLRDRLS